MLAKLLPDPGRRTLLLQALRYGVAGLLITLAFSATYWLLTVLTGMDANLALTLVFIVFSGLSYVAHGQFSFAGHGERDRPHVRLGRFFAVNILGFLANQFWVWLLVKQLGGPTWWPVVPFILVTPWLTFVLHRRWVYA
jgi:putative flippase GtrA